MITKYVLVKNSENDLGDKYTDILSIYSDVDQAVEILKRLYISSIKEAIENSYRVSDIFIGSQNRYRSFHAEKETDAYEVSYKIEMTNEYEKGEQIVI